MAIQRTFSIIKPDATKRNLTGKIIAKFEDAGLRIVASKRIHMSREQAEGFYAVHKERPFFGELVDFMISEPVVVQVLEGEDAIAKNREVMGAEIVGSGFCLLEFEGPGGNAGPFSFLTPSCQHAARSGL